MKLPHMKHRDSIVKQTRVKFGGYNHSLYARDGDIFDMENITSDNYPVISSRDNRGIANNPEVIMFCSNNCYYQNSTEISIPSAVEVPIGVGDLVKVVIDDEEQSYIISGLNYDGSNYFITFEGADLGDGTNSKIGGEVKIILLQKSGEDEVPNIKISALGSGDKIYFVTDTGDFYYDGVYRGNIGTGGVSFAETGAFIYISPNNWIFNKNTKTLTEIPSVTLKQERRGYDNNEAIIYKIQKVRDQNTIEISDDYKHEQPFFILNGDSLTIEAKTNWGTSVRIQGTVSEYKFEKVNLGYDIHRIKFSDDIFSGGNWPSNGSIHSITISRSVPDLKYVCAVNNRFWGCSDDTIYCTAFGEPDKWFFYPASSDGNVSDGAWSIKPFTENGEFTGCAVCNGYPIFFKENRIYKVYGSNAENFQLSEDEAPGVMKGANKSIKVIDDCIYYLSPDGVMRYTMNTTTNLCESFYEKFYEGVGGSVFGKYYISMRGKNGYRIFCYDTKKRLWSCEDRLKVTDFTTYEGRLYALTDDNSVLCMTPRQEMSGCPLHSGDMMTEENVHSFIEFGDYYCDSPDKKGISKLFFRVELQKGASLTLKINYDSEIDDSGQREYKTVKTVDATNKKSFTLPVIPRRCDHFRIRLEGIGKFSLYSLSYEYYNGSEM